MVKGAVIRIAKYLWGSFIDGNKMGMGDNWP